MSIEARRIRGGVVVVRDGRLAAIERHRAGRHYFVVPGGGCEDGESPSDAAVREGFEELGLRLRMRGLVAVVTRQNHEQHYFEAQIVGGTFGTGTGPEMAETADSPEGSHRAVWLDLDALAGRDLRPVSLRDRLAAPADGIGRVLAELRARPMRVQEP